MIIDRIITIIEYFFLFVACCALAIGISGLAIAYLMAIQYVVFGGAK